MLFDTHSHLDDEKFDADRDELIQKIHEEDGVGLMMCVGADMESSRRAIKLAGAVRLYLRCCWRSPA